MKTRQSNIELLRFFSMLMIAVFHINGHALESGEFLSSQWVAYNLTHTLTVTATTVFVLISGYFGIHFKTKGVLNLYLRCFIWGLVGYLIWSLPPHQISFPTLMARFMAFTHNKWWFIVTYLELYFLSPILNAAIEMFDKKKHMLSIVVFGFITLYMGYCRETGEDSWGTSLSHFLWLYMIARYIKLYISLDFINKYRWTWLVGFVVSSGIIFILAILGVKYTLPNCLWAYPNCSPWVLMGALSLLLFALSFTFENKLVNWLASSSISSYLMDGSAYFGLWVWYPWLASWMMPLPLSVRYGILVPFALIWLCSVCVIDKLWEQILYKPVMKLFDKLPYSNFSL